MNGSDRAWRTALALACLAILIASTQNCAPKARLIAEWNASDESSTTRIVHGAWQELLDGYLQTDDPSGIHRFDYGALKASSADTGKLASYLDGLAAMDPREYRRDEQLAYWLNLYNALTVQVVLSEYPVVSIRTITESAVPLLGPWDDVHVEVAGLELTLNDIEHGILRPIWNDPRIHYGANCASLGCPNLQPKAFTAETVDVQLDAAARAFVNHPRGIDVRDVETAVASSLYSWYIEDFGDSEQGILEHMSGYAEGDLQQRLDSFEGSLEFDYDWRLNAPQGVRPPQTPW